MLLKITSPMTSIPPYSIFQKHPPKEYLIQVRGKEYQWSKEELKDTLINVRNARKAAHWICGDLSVTVSSLLGRIFWCIIKYFPCLRRFFYNIDHENARLMLQKLEPLVAHDKTLNTLYREAVENFEAIAPRHLVEEISSWPRKNPTFKKLASSTQVPCQGWVATSKVQNIVSELKLKAPQTIFFKRRLLGRWIEGGNCSAISIDFIRKYRKRKLNEKPLNEWTQELYSLAKKFSDTSGNIKYKNQQMAFNSFSVKKEFRQQFRNDTLDLTRYDLTRDKVASFANLYFNITHASAQFDIRSDTKDVLNDELEKMPEGIYLLRVIKPLNTSKLEEYGHSMVYIKEKEGQAFFDCNSGVEILEKNAESRVFDHLAHNMAKYEVSQSRFYQMA